MAMKLATTDSPHDTLLSDLAAKLDAAADAYQAIAQDAASSSGYGHVDVHLIARAMNAANSLRGKSRRITLHRHI